MTTVAAFSPVWAATGTKDDPADFNSTRITQGFVAEEVPFELMNSLIDREEVKINELVDVAPTSDQKGAMTAADPPYNPELYFHVFDHFQSNPGYDINTKTDNWIFSNSGGAGGINLTGPSGILTIASDVDTNDYSQMLGHSSEILVSKNPLMRASFKLVQTTSYECWFGMYYDANNYIVFYADSTSEYWKTKTKATSETSNTSAVATDTSYHKFEIVITGGNSVDFKIDNATLFTHTTNIPSIACVRMLRIKTLTTAAKSVSIDWFHLRQSM